MLDPDVSDHVVVGLCGHIESQQGTAASQTVEIVGQGQGNFWKTLALKLLQQTHYRYAGLVTDAKH